MPTDPPIAVKAAADCADMDEVRAAIDALDRRIVALLAERAAYVHRAAALKPARADVVVPSRIADVVAKARAGAEASGLDPEVAEAVYRAMIDAFIAAEQREWDRLRR